MESIFTGFEPILVWIKFKNYNKKIEKLPLSAKNDHLVQFFLIDPPHFVTT